MKKYISEFIGTLVLVLLGCGVAVLKGEDTLAVAVAFGLAVMAMAYAVGPISGGHFNPAVTLGMFINKRIDSKNMVSYMIAQILGALAGSLILFLILSTTPLGTENLGANAFGDATGVKVLGAILVEVVLTFIFVYTVLCVSSDEKNKSAGLIIGLTLTLVHLFGIPLTGTSVNPARSIAPALILGGKAFSQVWVFILAPTIGAALAGFLYKFLNAKK